MSTWNTSKEMLSLSQGLVRTGDLPSERTTQEGIEFIQKYCVLYSTYITSSVHSRKRTSISITLPAET